MLRELDLEGIGEIDEGRVGIAVRQEMMALAHDLENRPGDDSTRTLSIKLKIKPVMAQDGSLAGADLQAFVSKALPNRRSEQTRALVKRDGDGRPGLWFNALSRDDPKQQTLDQLVVDGANVDPDTGEVLDDEQESENES